MITLTNNTDGLFFYSELISGSYVEGNPYLFTFTDQFEKSNTYDIALTCSLVDGYITTFSGDLSPIVKGKNFSIDIENEETFETLRALWTV